MQEPASVSTNATQIAAHILAIHLVKGVRIAPDAALLDEIAALARRIDAAAGA
jgi:hypothetical protein